MRLIDADAWIDAHCDGCEYKNSHFCSAEDPVCGAVETMNEAPTIDAVEVVRCKDCRYWDDDRRCNGIENGLVREYTREDDFCSYGERKNNED